MTSKRRGDAPTNSADSRYEHAIPSRKELLEVLNKASGPLALEKLGAEFGITTDQHRRALEQRLRAMVRDGQLIHNRARKYCVVEALDLVVGRVQAHRDGFGFLIPDAGGDDVYLSAREMRTLWDGDRVAIRVSPGRRDGLEGRVAEILTRAKEFIVGQFRRERGINYVLEHGDERTEVLIGRADSGGAKPGDIVRVEIIDYPTERSPAIGRVAEKMGRHDSPGVETAIAIESHGIRNQWPEAVAAMVVKIPDQVPSAAKRDRVDLRALPLVTIDGADAKDFDDAVYCETSNGGWRLLVAIADVSHYVQPDDPLDGEAQQRGTSVYFPDRVVPMLPEVLSNGLCSLNPDVDRLCVVCEMEISANGKVEKSKFYDAVMRSHARLTYERAAELLSAGTDSANAMSAKDRSLRATLEPLSALYQVFSKARSRRGAINFDLGETVIELNESGAVAQITLRKRLVTHKIIEECMIAANVEAAKRLRTVKLPGLFRVHESPEPSRIEELRLFLSTFGIKLPPDGKLTPKHLSGILDSFEGKPEKELMDTVLLRTMSKAEYKPTNVGHFGLALDAYAHFTSPIRRYPDLVVHRALKWAMTHRSPKGYAYTQATMTALGVQCSAAERRADGAVWDVEEQLKCQYMQHRIGEEFDVVVASVVQFGLFVRIPELHIDGLVHVSVLPPDYYHRDPSGTTLLGERTGQKFRLADRLRVKLSKVNLEERKIDFVPVDHGNDEPQLPRKKRRRRG
jgi:ribonuclease R